MPSVVEVRHDPVSTAKSYARQVASGQIIIPRYNEDILNGRWRAIYNGKNRILQGDEERVVREMLKIVCNMNRITTQREVWYMIRGNHPDWTYKGLDMKNSKVYDAITGPLMESAQLSTNHTIQSLGIWAGPRGYVTGDGTITTAVRGTFPLSAMPALSFDLVDVGVQINSRARKIIHFEKDAGFQGLATQDVCKMIESQFSTCQGYLVEAGNKYLADCQRRGMNIYVVHDADPHGCFTHSAFVTPVEGDSTNIDKFNIGDELYTLDDEKNLVKTKIINKSERWVSSEEILCIKINTPRINRNGLKTNVIMCTKNHPFDVVTENGDVNWVPAEKLIVGDILVDAGNLVINEKVRVQKPNMKGIEKYKDCHLSWAKSLSREAMKKITPSKTELFLLGLFTYEKLPIEWVGGTLEIGGTNDKIFQRGIYPDFHIIGTKKLIEVSCKSYLEYRKEISYDQYKKERKQIYEKHGYTVIFIDVDEDTPFEILKKVKSFISNGSKIIEITPIGGRQLSRLIQGKQAKRDENGKLWVKVFNFECSPYNSYLVDNVHVHNCQMALMYGMSSKSSSYMPSSFYPYPNTTKLLGLFPTVAQSLNLPPEDISESSQKILPNIQKLCDSHPDMQEEVDVLVNENQQWEFQALSGRGEKASLFYLLESLRASEDEIKYVPSADRCKNTILEAIKTRKDNFVEWYIDSFVDNWFNRSGGLKDQIKTKLREKLKDQIEKFQKDADEGYEKLEDVNDEDFREAVKMKLVDYPVQYASDAMSSIVYQVTDYEFEIKSEPEVSVELDEKTGVEVEATTNDLEIAEEQLTKDDIIESIESRIISDEDERKELQSSLRQALETKRPNINLEW